MDEQRKGSLEKGATLRKLESMKERDTVGKNNSSLQ